MIAVIIAGGKGTRLKGLNSDIPKALFPICGKPIVEYQIENLKQNGITEIILIVGHMGNAIKEYCGNGEKWNVHIDYLTEEVPLGTGGSLYYLKHRVHDAFLILYGDLIFDVDIKSFVKFHQQKKAEITLFIHPNSHPYDSDLIVINNDRKVCSIISKYDDRKTFYHNFVNAGIYCLNPSALNWFTEVRNTDLDRVFIAEMIEEGKVYAYRSSEYVKDIGTPDRLFDVEKDILSGVVKSKNRSYKQKAVFLDRDGTINELNGFINKPDQFVLIPDVAPSIKRLNESNFLTIVATNQPVIARGECTTSELDSIHKKMETLLGEQGAYVDDIKYCPHHPHKGFDGEVAELKVECDCRKPRIGMISDAAVQYNIDLSKSWIIGDTTVDIKMGINAGLKTILLCTGEGGKDGKYEASPDFMAKDLSGAVDIILGSDL